MLEAVKGLLSTLGYEVQGDDEMLLNFCISKVTSTIKNDINWQEIPEGLRPIAVNMVLGEFLMAKKTFMPDSLSMLDLGVGIKQLQEGDKNTTFATGESTQTDEQRLNAFISHLLTDGRDEFGSYRRLRWN
ncbi:MAG: hypothetical protein LUG61_11125 [Lachnospiraceae bacterium]|nr:hypothetical protein [Lachnospiraceae bacterium]